MKAVLRIFTLLTLALMTLGTGLQAQSGSQYSVRFVLGEVDCVNEVVFIDLEVKALEGSPEFHISDQNYRFSFDDNAVKNPRIVQELEISGSTFGNEYSAFFESHHLNGSIDTIISYNVVLTGGTGYPIDDSRWFPVGTIGFDIVDMDACMELKWHTHAPNDFPPTYVGEKFGGITGVLYELPEGSYDNGGPDMDPYDGDIVCFRVPCPPLPIELESFEGLDKGCTAELYWTTLSETNNDYFLVEKSDNGVDWQSIGRLNGNGTTTDTHTYKYTDRNITNIVGYYRIKQVDYDGQSNTSTSITIRSTCYNDQISIGITEIFPNPVKNDDRVNIEFYTERGDDQAQLIVTDELGRVVLDSRQDLREGPNTLSFKAGSLAAGMYFVQVRGENWYSSVQKFVKVVAE